MTIRYLLCGVPSLGLKAPDDLIFELKRLFGLLQVPFETVIRTEGVRYSFINYNFCFRRFFDLLGVPHYSRDFPPLKSKKKREDTIWLWLKIIDFLKWPYLNSDGRTFGSEFETRISDLRARRIANAQRRTSRREQKEQPTGSKRRKCALRGTSETEDASGSDNRLRRECSASASTQTDQPICDETLLSFLHTHDSPGSVHDTWDCNDDAYSLLFS